MRFGCYLPALVRTATATAFRDARILRGATDKNGRYDAAKLARLLDWTISDIAQYLGRDASTISRFGASPIHQEERAVVDLRDPAVHKLLETDSVELSINFRSVPAGAPPAATQILGERAARPASGLTACLMNHPPVRDISISPSSRPR
jgi:hypothetical protein